MACLQCCSIGHQCCSIGRNISCMIDPSSLAQHMAVCCTSTCLSSRQVDKLCNTVLLWVHVSYIRSISDATAIDITRLSDSTTILPFSWFPSSVSHKMLHASVSCSTYIHQDAQPLFGGNISATTAQQTYATALLSAYRYTCQLLLSTQHRQQFVRRCLNFRQSRICLWFHDSVQNVRLMTRCTHIAADAGCRQSADALSCYARCCLNIHVTLTNACCSLRRDIIPSGQ